ncbi:hypothetical protein GGR54DRAFT_220863 [Hypoxylon sp. NC1633]|nr:hypothetical protein GGR54DRAFT_220863 [Hypoxylon sp. NC1633]
MAEPSPLKATPKRKRDDVINRQQNINSTPITSSLSKPVFSFQAPILRPVDKSHRDTFEDGNSSPRSRVAQKFQELALGSGGGVTDKDGNGVVMGTASDEADPQRAIDTMRFSPELPVFDFDVGSSSGLTAQDMQLDDDDNVARKRVKFPGPEDLRDIPEMGLSDETDATDPDSDRSIDSGRFAVQAAVDSAITSTEKSDESDRLQKSYPSINRLAASKSRGRRRAGTPPFAKRRGVEPSIEQEHVVTDPIRAALTWHEDEITVYDPEDKDDDGTGINGIGFKPTPAIAYARAQRRRQQLAEYKKREESEARARRNQRRRQQVGGAVELERKHSNMRVRFSDAEPTAVVTN